MHTITDLVNELQKHTESDFFDLDTYEILDNYSLDKSSKSDFESLFLFFERNPNTEYGSPGSLVHFMEEYDCPNYEIALEESILRKPTAHTLWMLNRVINAKIEPEKSRLIDIMKQVLSMNIYDDVRETAEGFLDYQQ